LAPPPVDEDDDSIWADDPNELIDFKEAPVATMGGGSQPGSYQPGAGPTQVSIGFGAIADFALDRGMISWALIWGLVWTISVAMTGLLARLLPAVTPILPFVFMLLTWGCYIASISGISRLAVLKALSGTTHGLTEAWNLLARRGVSLLLGTLAIGLGVGLGVVFVFGGIYGLSHIPHAGGVLGGILMVPTFLIILLAFSLGINLYLIPIIISVEDCTAIRAGEILIRVTSQNGFALLGRYLRALASLIPFALFSGFLTAGGLMGAFFLCGGEQILYSLRGGIPVGSMLQALSAVFVVAAWMAFLVVFTTVSFTLVYCDSSERTNTREA